MFALIALMLWKPLSIDSLSPCISALTLALMSCMLSMITGMIALCSLTLSLMLCMLSVITGTLSPLSGSGSLLSGGSPPRPDLNKGGIPKRTFQKFQNFSETSKFQMMAMQ